MSWEENVRKVVPYVPGEQPKVSGLIKLNTNENPYPPAPKVQEYLNNMDADIFRKYPDPLCQKLVSALAKTYNVDESQVFTGIGSDDVLAMCFLTFFNSSKEILFPDITYSFYDVWANLFRIPYRQVPLNDDFIINADDYLAENGGIVIANPNAPTGVELEIGEIEKIVKANPDSVVIIDEAYVDFGGTSALPLIDKYDNVLVVQTFSKSRSMAGIRIGYVFGSKKLIGYLNNVKFAFNSYTMNSVTLELGAIVLEDAEYTKECCEKVIATREWFKKELVKLGFTFGDSKTNFVFAKHSTMQRDEIFKKLRERNILVRAFNNARIKDYLRISIGTDEEMRTVVNELKAVLNE